MRKEDLIGFLMEKGVYDDFMRNFKTSAENNGIEWDEESIFNVVFLLVEMFGDTPITYAFTWDDTPEGHSFWKKINDEFKKEFNLM